MALWLITMDLLSRVNSPERADEAAQPQAEDEADDDIAHVVDAGSDAAPPDPEDEQRRPLLPLWMKERRPDEDGAAARAVPAGEAMYIRPAPVEEAPTSGAPPFKDALDAQGHQQRADKAHDPPLDLPFAGWVFMPLLPEDRRDPRPDDGIAGVCADCRQPEERVAPAAYILDERNSLGEEHIHSDQPAYESLQCSHFCGFTFLDQR